MRPLIEPYVDGELDANRQAQIVEHMAECASCSEDYRRVQKLQSDIRGGDLYFRAPDVLRERVTRRLQDTGRAPGQRAAIGWPWKGMAIAASLLLVLSLGTNILLTKAYRSEDQTIAHEVWSEHLRSVMGGHLVEVASSDRHTVKPWFTGKLDFSPTVVDLAPQGFPLSGGRVDYIEGRRVAALIFLRNKHVITLFTWPSSRSAGEASSRDGYNLEEWTKNGMMYWAVSDLNRSELETFSALYKKFAL
jgi:anti-sigma factor RsiW